jgi:hypothetical protein
MQGADDWKSTTATYGSSRGFVMATIRRSLLFVRVWVRDVLSCDATKQQICVSIRSRVTSTDMILHFVISYLCFFSSLAEAQRIAFGT